MKIIILLSLLAGVLGQLFPSWSFTPEDGERDFHKYDLNSDGFWQLRELLHVFDSFDINGDRFVTMDEVNRFLPSGYPQRELQGMFKYCDRMDGTNDDKIARRSVNNIFDIFDTDGNGVVSFAEFQRNVPMVWTRILQEIEAAMMAWSRG